jgi:hypothetical protein
MLKYILKYNKDKLTNNNMSELTKQISVLIKQNEGMEISF